MFRRRSSPCGDHCGDSCAFDVKVSGTLVNTQQDIRLRLDDTDSLSANISGGPLQYHYRVSDVIIRFGSDDARGSEHSINGHFFPAEVCSSPSRVYMLLVTCDVSAKPEFCQLPVNREPYYWRSSFQRIERTCKNDLPSTSCAPE